MTHPSYSPPPNSGLELLYQDDELLVFDKPSGLLSVPGRGRDKQDSLLTRVRDEFPDALTVHRLDMETSGVMLFARGLETQRYLGGLFEKRRIRKRYIAVVDGLVPHEQGEIDKPLITDWPNRPRQIVDDQHGKASLTCYKVIRRYIETHTTRVELAPETGRTHQIRVHLQSIGHPVLGDSLYAPPGARDRSHRLLLHAVSLSLPQARTGERLRFISHAPF